MLICKGRTMRKIVPSATLVVVLTSSCCPNSEVTQPDWVSHYDGAEEALQAHDFARASRECRYLAKLDDNQPPRSIPFTLADIDYNGLRFGFKLSTLAEAFHHEDLDTEAEILYRKAVRAQQAELGKDSPAVAGQSQKMLTQFLWEKGKFAEARNSEASTASLGDEEKIDSLLSSARGLQLNGQLDEAERRLTKAFQIAVLKEHLQALEAGKGNTGAQSDYRLSWQTLNELASFYDGNLIFERARPVVLRLQSLEDKMEKMGSRLSDNIQRIWKFRHWKQLIDIDLGQNKFEQALEDGRKMKLAIQSLGASYKCIAEEAQAHQQELAERISIMVSSRKKKPAEKPVGQGEWSSLIDKSNAICVCRIEGWRLGEGYACNVGGRNTYRAGATEVYITPVRAFTADLPMEYSRVYLNPDNWQVPQSIANTLLRLQSCRKYALLFAGKKPCASRTNKVLGRDMKIPAYYQVLAAMDASPDNIRMLEKLTRAKGNSVK
jgi:hypothetical protein